MGISLLTMNLEVMEPGGPLQSPAQTPTLAIRRSLSYGNIYDIIGSNHLFLLRGLQVRILLGSPEFRFYNGATGASFILPTLPLGFGPDPLTSL